MTIFTEVKTHYDELTTVSRAVDNKVARIDMSKTLPKAYPTSELQLLNKLANLSNEDFKALADFQSRRT